MHKQFKEHGWYYISLIAILVLGFGLILLATPDLRLQTIIMVFTVFSYVAWGALHHLINHDLTARILLEYILIGVLGLSILFFISMGG